MTAGQSSIRPAAVLFDMDGTLSDSEKLWTVAMEDFAAHSGGALTPDTRARMVGSNMTRSMEMLLADLGSPCGPDEVTRAAAWVEVRISELFANGVPWRPGAEETLRSVLAASIPTALVTSTIRSLTEIALDTLGRDSFQATVCGDEVGGHNKPEPEPYLRACRMLGVDPVDCVAIEDSPTGVASAVAAGCTVLAVPCEVPLEPGHRRILLDSLEGIDASSLGNLLAEVPTR